jgi:putative membrane protein
MKHRQRIHSLQANDRASDESLARLSLSDRLALERTELANERTMLAYVRTSLACLGAGVALFHFLEHSLFWKITGWLLAAASVLILSIGSARYFATTIRVRRSLVAEKETPAPLDQTRENAL